MLGESGERGKAYFIYFIAMPISDLKSCGRWGKGAIVRAEVILNCLLSITWRMSDVKRTQYLCLWWPNEPHTFFRVVQAYQILCPNCLKVHRVLMVISLPDSADPARA